MLKYNVTHKDQTDIEHILMGVVEYTGFEASAIALEDELYSKFELLSFMPSIGRSREDGTQEIFCRGYRIIYKRNALSVDILTVIHSCRLYPRP